MDPNALALDRNSPATPVEIAALTGWCSVPLPPDYLNFLRFSNGGQLTSSTYPRCRRLWSIRDVLGNNRDYEIARWVPGYIGIGDDGGEVVIGFDTRTGLPYPVVVIPFAPMEWVAAVTVATDFDTFLCQAAPTGDANTA